MAKLPVGTTGSSLRFFLYHRTRLGSKEGKNSLVFPTEAMLFVRKKKLKMSSLHRLPI